MKVYIDMYHNEIVTEDVARTRVNASIDDSDIMFYLFKYVSLDELRQHMINDEFIAEIINTIGNNWFNERFKEYDLVESAKSKSKE